MDTRFLKTLAILNSERRKGELELMLALARLEEEPPEKLIEGFLKSEESYRRRIERLLEKEVNHG